MKKAVFLDRDGTVNVEKNYLYRIEDFEYIDGAVEALHILEELGYLLIIITNQSGIARGYYTEKDFFRLNKWMISDLENKKIHVSKVYHCPHYLNGSIKKYVMQCNCRKPQTGLFWQAQKDFNLNMKLCYAVGDKIRDLLICNESDVQGIFLGDKSELINVNFKKKLWVCENLLWAAKRIEGESKC